MSSVSIFREGADSGDWCSILLPIAIFISNYKREVPISDVYNYQVMMAFSLSVYSIYFLYKICGCKMLEDFFKKQISDLRISDDLSLKLKYTAQKLSTENYIFALKWNLNQVRFLGICLTVTFLFTSIRSMVFIAFGLSAFVYSLPRVFLVFQKSFSLGEGCLVLQSVVLFLTVAAISCWEGSDDPTTVIGSYSIIAKLVLLSLTFVCLVAQIPNFEWIRSPTVFHVFGFALLGCFTIPIIQMKLRRNPIFWIVETVFGSHRLVMLTLFWIVCVRASINEVNNRIANGEKATSVDRKYFHGVVVLVFTSGVIIDRNFLFFASTIVMAFLVLFEFIRVMKIAPLGPLLDKAFDLYLDEKDGGPLILAHFYLLAGASLPLWLSPNLDSANPLVLLSGVISIGIGDSIACIVGSSHGRVRFPDSEKTVEGTAAAIFAQVCFIIFISLFFRGGITINPGIIISITFCSIVEAMTSQVDNIVLPLIMFSLFTICI